jgi:hypothetical protein
MSQTVVENKYSFNMQVSAEAMAAPDRDRPHQKAAVTQRLLTRPFSQLGCAVTPCPRENGRWNLASNVRKRPGFTNPLWIQAIRRFRKRAVLAARCAGDVARCE